MESHPIRCRSRGDSQPPLSSKEAEEAEVAVLVSLPCDPMLSRVPRVPGSGGTSAEGDTAAQHPIISDYRWSRYSVGIAQVPYLSDEDSTISP